MRAIVISMGRATTSIAIALAIAGCYNPRLPEGLPCSVDNECPGTQRCDPVTRTCGGELADGPVVPCDFRGVAAGRQHTCAIDGAGAVWCWGLNDAGQSAPGGARHALVPARIELPMPAAQIAAGRDFSCARLDGGAVWCWGDNEDGELGDGTTEFRSAPVAVALGAERAIDLGAGSHHACIRRERDLAIMCWGNNQTRALGVTGIPRSATPVEVPGLAGATQLAVGHRQNCALDAAGVPSCWGHNTNGQLGDGNFTNSAAPVLVSGLGDAVTRISTGGRFSCAIENGDVRCWGANGRGELGRGDYEGDPLPGPAAIGGAIDVQSGAAGACVLLADGGVACWGELDVGDGNVSITSTPRTANITGVQRLATGYYHTCTIAGDRLLCWGSNEEGELGRGTRAMSAIPVPVPLDDIDAVSVGRYYACALRGGGLWCWGRNNEGTLGTGDMVTALAPVAVATGLPTVDGVAAGSWHVCAWGGGNLRCWGDNYNGECGTGATSIRVLSPAPVNGVTGVTQVGMGWDHTCALATGGVHCWGANSQGQLGNGTTTPSLAPVVALGPGPTAIAIGRAHGCALFPGGTVQCWGANLDGQLGDGTTTTRLAPVPTVALPGPVTRVAAGAFHTCAIIQDGDLHCWGTNGEGELGVGDLAVHAAPVRVPLPGPALDVVATEAGTCARLATGAYCWGRSRGGELGTGATVGSPSPAPLASLGAIDQIARGDRGGCARTGGAVSCWGEWRLLANSDASVAVPAAPLFSCR